MNDPITVKELIEKLQKIDSENSHIFLEPDNTAVISINHLMITDATKDVHGVVSLTCCDWLVKRKQREMRKAGE